MATAEARPVTVVPFSTVTAICAAGTVEAAAVALAVVEAAAVLSPEELVRDWSFAMVANRLWAVAAGTSRLLSPGSGAVCMVVKVMRFAGTLSTSAASPISLLMLPSPVSTVRALVAASARR